jgi:hypothetical protein
VDEHGVLACTYSHPVYAPFAANHTQDENGETQEEKNMETLAEAGRNLLSEVLKTAGFSRKRESSEHAQKITRKTKAIIDLGFGCGDQTVYLMAPAPHQDSDKLWWDLQSHVPILDSYTGMTLDAKQFQYAQKRVDHLRAYGAPLEPETWPGKWSKGINNTKIYRADAGNPDAWSEELKTRVKSEIKQVDEPWVLALDTLYHFSPSRWPVVNYTSHLLQASFMAFDLCLADSVSYPNLLALRILTRFMGAPWANFVTKEQYREKLVEAGYRDIVIRDVSKQVFGPLASFLEGQGRRLEGIGLRLGPFHVAKWLFGWWGRTGIVRGVIVVAKHPSVSVV